MGSSKLRFSLELPGSVGDIDAPAAAPDNGVEISCDGTACEAAKQACGNRYAAGAAPALPLPRCPWPARCNCRYQPSGAAERGPGSTPESD